MFQNRRKKAGTIETNENPAVKERSKKKTHQHIDTFSFSRCRHRWKISYKQRLPARAYINATMMYQRSRLRNDAPITSANAARRD